MSAREAHGTAGNTFRHCLQDAGIQDLLHVHDVGQRGKIEDRD